MTTLQEENDCQTVDRNDGIAMEVNTGLCFPSDNTINMVLTGHFNGFGVEVRSDEAIGPLYHMGCFGKGSMSRSRPNISQNSDQLSILRKRQYLKRNQWFKNYSKHVCMSGADHLMRDIKNLTYDILKDTKHKSKDVIDLVSTDDSDSESMENEDKSNVSSFHTQETVVVVPNSESEEDNYFANLKPKCCLNKTKLKEKLMLTAQEAFFLMYGLGCLQVIDCSKVLSVEECWMLFSERDQKFVEKYVVYHYYRSKGYIVKPGIKFGGDYLLYKDGPEVNHADYIVVIRFNDNNFNWTSILGHVRVANNTSKQILIVDVVKSNKTKLQLPQDFSEFSVREMLLDRNIPISINDEID